MKRRTALASAVTVLAASLAAAHGNPRAEPKVELAGKTVSVEYGRPSLKGRDMLGQAPVGTVWRMGADAATTLTTAAQLRFGDRSVPAGKYVLKVKKVDDTAWHLLVTGNDATVAEVPMAASALAESVELFTIELSGEGSQGRIEMKWGTTALASEFSAE